ncbi:hypothetical protein EZY14_001410 [Kordia sp. TARA_039_SRF]|jgi:hypothetical protein|nr:hypothetical protein EZY14_001410 [Kordia sp. TARA_039_SRF]
MKKKNLKSLKLNKKSISDLGKTSMHGGATGPLCYKDTKQDGDCWVPTIMQTFYCPKTVTICGQPPCIRPDN